MPRRAGALPSARRASIRFPVEGAAVELRGSIAEAELDLPRFGRGLLVRLPGVRRGFSGGPVLDAEGRFVGMITSIRVASRGPPTSPRQMAFAPIRLQEADEAFVLRASDIRREVARMLKQYRA
jgi:CBS domain-containing protein